MNETQVKIGNSSTSARTQKRPSYFSGNNDVSTRSESEFRDAEAWDERDR